MRKPISQREARRLRKQVQMLRTALKTQNDAWSSEWPGGVHIASLTVASHHFAAAKVARRLGHAVVVAIGAHDELRLYAVRLDQHEEGSR